MSKFQARAALDQLVGRPALVSQTYASQGMGLNSEVTSGAMLADIRELADAVPNEEIAATGDRNRLLASTYNFDVVDENKPFIFSGGFALIPIHGILINRFSYSWGFATGYNFIRNQVAAASTDDDVKAIIFDVNSCGGMVSGCQETADLMFEANAANGGKPLIAVIDANCHSAAYFLTSQCDHVAITPSGNAANIGVLMVHFDVSQMMDNIGVKVSIITAGAHKVDGNPYEPLSPEVRAEFQADIDATYDVFVAAVVRGRGLDDQAVRDTEARSYSSGDALALGLVDAIQNPSDAVEAYFESCEASDDDDTGEETGDTPDDDPPEPEENAMTTKPVPGAARQTPAAVAAATTTEVTSDTAQASADARVAERTRISAIQTNAEAVGREALAAHLALNTDLDVDTATGILAASPKATAPAAAAVPAPTGATAETNHFKQAMDNGQQPNVGASSGTGNNDDDKNVTPAQRILAAQLRTTTVRVPATKH